MSFIFGGNTPWSYEQVQRQRQIAASLASRMGTPKNVGEGLSAIGRALAVRGINKRADARENELRDEFNADWDNMFSGGSAGGGSTGSFGTYTPPPAETAEMYPVGEPVDPNRAPTPEYPVGEEVQPDVVALIHETADALGASPLDVATAISYETGGTFNPTQAGPTTQHGQHRGYIQFGEPQAEQYGVDWDNPINSQLGRDGAIVRYFQDNGWQPGMSFLDMYSIINAGAPGRYNASDAHNGGAPGTVADKVNNQMDGHRRAAAAFLGGNYTPGTPARGDFSMQALAEIAGNPMASPGQRAIVNQLLQQQMQAQDPLYQMNLERQRLELEQLRNPTVDPMDAINLELAQINLENARTPERERVVDANGRLRYVDTQELVFPDLEVTPEDADPMDATELRKEFSGLPAVKNFSEQSAAFGRVVASAQDPSPAGDLALIFNYMKVLDPGSVVRESEFATAAASGSYGERIQAAVNQVTRGERLSDDMREDFLKRAESLYQDAERQYQGLYDQYSARAEGGGLDPVNALNDFRYVGATAPQASPRPQGRPERQVAFGPPVAPQDIPPAPPRPDGFVGDWEWLWERMKPEERAAFQ